MVPIEIFLKIDTNFISYPNTYSTWNDMVQGYPTLFSLNQSGKVEYEGKVIYYNGVLVAGTDNLVQDGQYFTINDLTGTKWVLNSNASFNSNISYGINFTSNSQQYISLECTGTLTRGKILYNKDENTYDEVADNDGDIGGFTVTSWANQAYRIIEITGGTDATDVDLISWLMSNATQIQVGDLTGTKWVINKTPNPSPLSGGIFFNISFISNNRTFSEIIIGDNLEPGLNSINYYTENDVDVYWFSSNSWVNEAYRLISITSGDDVSNPDLLVWLNNNATLVPVVDLSGTEWYFNSVIDLLASTYFINFKSDGIDYDSIKPWLFEYGGMKYGNNGVYLNGEWLSENTRTISITDGTDIANPDLIAWLSQNATYQSQPVTPTITYDLTQLQLSAGTHTVQVRARAQNYRDSEFSNSVTYNVPQKYSGNIETYSGFDFADTKIKFDTPPQNENDYDSATRSGFSGIYDGLTSYQNKTKIYIWSGLNAQSGGKVKINNIETNGGTTYDTAVELNLTGDYTIYLFWGRIA